MTSKRGRIVLFEYDPLLLKEVRTRMRARTVAVVENLYILAICSIVVMSLFMFSDMDSDLGWELGRSLFRTLTYVQAVLMLFVSPLIAASAITSEKEQKTYDSLRAAPVSSARIVRTKLAAALSCFLMLIIVSLPMVSISFILGGVDPTDLLKAYSFTILCTIAAGAMGLYWSARFERSIAAIPAASITAILVMIVASILQEIDMSALAMLSPIEYLRALYEDLEINFYGKLSPFWIPGLLFPFLLTIYFFLSTTVRLEFPQRRSYLLLRGMGLLLFVALSVFLVGEIAAPQRTVGSARSIVGQALVKYLIAWLLFAPWLGANRPVSESEDRGLHMVSRGDLRWVRKTFLWGPAFVVLLVLAGCPALSAALATVGDLKMPHAFVWITYFGILGLSSVTWALLALRLAGRGSAKRRFIGMAVGYLLSLVIVIAPFAVLGIVSENSENGVPLVIQAVSLLSPATALGFVCDPHMATRSLADIVNLLGRQGMLLVTVGLYGLSTILLLLPSFSRRDQ